jgi:DNA-binding transcriptional regulator YhcF (GntR family)
METLDPNDSRPPFQQVASVIKASILTGKFQAGERLPSFGELAKHFGVAPMTVQKAVGILRDEGLVITRQGKGSFVRRRADRTVGLRPRVERVLQSGHASIDFVGFSSETLRGVVQESLDKIRSGTLGAQKLHFRILVPDLSVSMGFPSLAPSGEDFSAVRERMSKVLTRSAQSIIETVQELADLNIVESATAEIRTYRTSPVFKMFLLNRSEVFFGFYPIEEYTVSIDGVPVNIFDPKGKDAILFHWTKSDDPDAIGTQYVEQAQQWFDSVWKTVAKEYTL